MSLQGRGPTEEVTFEGELAAVISEFRQKKSAEPRRVAVIGAGPCGLAAARQFSKAGFDVRCFERHAEVGGNWNAENPSSSVHARTRMISSKGLTEFQELRMPRSYSQYPTHTEALDYLRSYVHEFGLTQCIECGREVVRLRPDAPGSMGRNWRITLDSGEEADFDAVIVANGHHWDPRWPDWVDRFSGVVQHAHDYWSADAWAGRRVLVVGGGNSGCDIAVEVAREAAQTLWSLRRGYHVFPKFLFGAPLDRCGETLDRWRLPLWLSDRIVQWCLHWSVGPPDRYGLPAVRHRVFASHPIVNGSVLQAVAHREMQVVGDVVDVDGDCVQFATGESIPVDVIICATGYHVRFPFFDKREGSWEPGRIPHELLLNLVSPAYPTLGFVGLIQPDGGIWRLAEQQAQLLARYWRVAWRAPEIGDAFLRALIAAQRRRPKWRPAAIDSPRHVFEVRYFAYRRELARWERWFERRALRENRRGVRATW